MINPPMKASLSNGLIYSDTSVCLYFLFPHAWISKVRSQLGCTSMEFGDELKIRMLCNFLIRNSRCAFANFDFRFTLDQSRTPKAFLLVASLSKSLVITSAHCLLSSART